MTLKLILWACIGWMPIMMCIMLNNEAKFKKNIVVGVTMPYEAREDTAVLNILKSYKKWMILVNAGMLVLAGACMFFSGDVMIMTSWLIWLDVAIIVPYIPYVYTNIKLKELKVLKGWDHTRNQQTISVNLDALPDSQWISPWVFAPSGLICLLLIFFDPEMTVMYILFAVMCLSFWAGYRYLYRNKAEMVDENTELTIVLSRIRKYNWGKMWIITSYAMSAYAVMMCFFQNAPLLSMILIIVVTIILCVYAFQIEFKTRHLQEKLTKDSGQEWYADEDDHWIWGIFYYNPNDSRLIINSRIGINSTVNMARTLGKVIMAAVVLLLASMPFMGVWMGAIGSQEIATTIEQDTFTISSGSTSYQIKASDIKEVVLLEELPSHLSRKMGTGMDTYLEGKFSADSIGNVTVLLDPTVSPYILIQTKDGKYYLFGTRDAAKTKDAYQQLTSMASIQQEVSPLTQLSYSLSC